MHPELLKHIERLNALPKQERYDMVGLSNLIDENEKIKIPKNIKQIKIDVGLSYSAPNAALWLCETGDRMVFGFEPNSLSSAGLIHGIAGRNGINENQAAICIKEGVIYRNSQVVESGINHRFKLIQCALDNVGKDNLHFVPFFMTSGDPGCSSLSMPTDMLPAEAKYGEEGMNVTMVGVMSFYDFLEKIPWDRFEFIEQVKLDTQGRDLDILKSCEEYLQKIVFLQVENSTNGEYEHSHTKEEIHEFIINNGFDHVSTIGVDSSYINSKYAHLAGELHNSVV